MKVRQRLRPAWSQEKLRELYTQQHDYRGWHDHRLRVPVTGQLAEWLREEIGATFAADLSCGEGAALDAVQLPAERKLYGDFSPGHPVCGPIEETISLIPAGSLLICGETIEHLDDPDAFLVKTRDFAGSLIVSTPVGSWGDDTPGHYWAWDREAVEDMLSRAGFSVVSYLEMSWPGNSILKHMFGIWACQ